MFRVAVAIGLLISSLSSVPAFPAAPAADRVASQAYFKSLNATLLEMRQKRAFNLTQLMSWNHYYAEKIDALPLLHVDAELIALGHAVASTFRGLAALENAVAVQNQYLAYVAVSGFISVPVYYDPNWGWPCGGVLYQDVDLNALTAYPSWQLYAYERNARAQVWVNIEDTRSLIRLHLVERYQVEFPMN